MDEFDLTANQAAGIVGNLGFESDGLQAIQERGVAAPRGGFGWAQWTGPRRRAFELWCAKEGLDQHSDEAQYGFLLEELHGDYYYVIQGLRNKTLVGAAVWHVGQTYERPGGTTPNNLPGFEARRYRAYQALDVMGKVPLDGPITSPAPPPVASPQPNSFLAWLRRLFGALA